MDSDATVDLGQWMRELTIALGLPEGATQKERIDRALWLAALDAPEPTEEEPPKKKGDPGVCRKCGATSDPGCEIPGNGCCWSHMGETICETCSGVRLTEQPWIKQ